MRYPDSSHIKPRFISVDVEVTNFCSNGCAMCPREAIKRPAGVMTGDIFRELIHFLGESRCLLTFSGMGDPLANPMLPEFIRMARSAGHETGAVVHPASFLSHRGGMERLLECPPHSITVSFPSVQPTVFERLCPVITFESALNQVMTLREKVAGRSRIRVSGILTRLNMDEKNEFRAFWKKYDFPCWVTPCHSRGGNLANYELLMETQDRGLAKGFCSLFMFHTFIAWNGDILACCHDLDGSTSLGTVPELLTFRHLLTIKERMASIRPCPSFKLCSRCDEPLRNISLPMLPETGSPEARHRFFQKLAAASKRSK